MKNSQRWTAENIPDQKGKVAIVTGSSSGIGYEAARVLANKNMEVIIAVRDRRKGDDAVRRIQEQNENADVKVMLLDLADLQAVKNFAAEFKRKYTKLDLLINNAGVMIPPYSKTEDGFELQFGTNHLGHFALTSRLLDLLTRTEGSRIVNVSSSAHKFGRIDFEDLHWEKRKYKPWNAYGDSKIANLYFTKELQERLSKAGSKTLVTAAHPGWTATDLQRHSGVMGFLNRFFAMGLEQGALPTLRAAFDENASGGEYYGPDGFMEWKGYPVRVESSELSKNSSISKRLWEISGKLTNSVYEFENSPENT